MDDTNNNNQDDFSFDEFLTPESKESLADETEKSVDVKIEDVKVDTPPTKEEPKTETTETVTPTDTTVEPEPTQVVTESGPVRAPNEPDWKYEYRKEIWQKQQELKQSPEDDKIALKSELQELRKEFSKFAKQKENEFAEIDEQPTTDEYVKKEDIAKIIEERERAARLDALEERFIESHPALKDKPKYDYLMRYVGDTYNLIGKSEKQINAILNMAYGDLFPDKSTQKISDAKTLEKKLSAVDFSGSSVPDNSKENEESVLVDNIKKSSGNDFSWIL